ncbi:hypothetical protein B0T17DRAFT_495461 [Bombardia bombarda]|uniref:Transcription initiation factor TFIID subunit 2 n=1 Tax=Bombardia bombarda TaxID=252184 RepID=A0AA39WMQ8_9PEZI|nr:hypothetical protein B0T17DRAFT_495461 [Bombardia bombarda]
MPNTLDGEAAAEAAAVPDQQGAIQPFVIVKQQVELDINFQNKSISGISIIHIFPMTSDLDEIMLDARQCEINVDDITVDGVKTKAKFDDPYDLMTAPPQWQIGATQYHTMMNRMRPLMPERRPDMPITTREKELLGCVPADRALKISLRPEGQFRDEPRRTLKIKTGKGEQDVSIDRLDPNDEERGIKVSIPFRSKLIRDGLHFVGIDEGDQRYPHVYTRHSIEPGTASCIFPCVDDPGSRHPWKLMITCPRTLGDVFEYKQQALATQPPAAAAPLNGNRKRKSGDISTARSKPHVCLLEEDKMMDMTVVCSGNLTGEQIDPKDDRKKTMTFECQNSGAQHIAFAIGPFEHVELWSEFRTEEADEKLGSNAAKIHAYCLPSRTADVRHTCQPIVEAADYFAPEFGRYPFESYKVCFVDDMIPDTTAATSMSLCSNRLLYPEDTTDTAIEVTRKLVHTLASQYIGVNIVPNQRSDSWLVIGIQWFMTDLFMRSLCGNNWYKFHLKTMADKLVEADINRPSIHDLGEHLHIGDFELDFMALKAPLVLFILDQRMSKIPGSTGVVRVISSIVSGANIDPLNPIMTSISAAEFRRSCEKKSQYRPDELWDQWVHGAGCPKLFIKQRFNKKNLNVDITISQTQGTSKPKSINREEFWREYQEEIHSVYAGEVPKIFTGPFTVRIHEADGTPYEHYQVITEKDKNGTNLQIAYNTKYKRLKRTKKAVAAAANISSDKHDIQEDDVIYFNMLGDVLTTQKDVENWGLQEWSEDIHTAMDQESYEWIRFDCNFEWVCETISDMPGYMYLAQLQQDRDVVAHQDALLYFARGKRHGVAATIETRTVMDRRYYHGIRTMAIEDLPKQADPDLNYIGLAQLILSFRHFFCYKAAGQAGNVTFPPLPNDFRDQAQYAVQCALAGAIARTREKGRCSKHGRNFLLELLLFNDNTDNEYSDQFYIATLLEALTTSLIPERHDGDGDLLSRLKADDDDDEEFKRFIKKTIDEIDKYRRMDEWSSSYQNIWTITALNCKMRLMKERVIPVDPVEFVQYLQDDNTDLIRIKGFECLVELGFISNSLVLKLLLSYMSTDKSPYVREQLFKIFCKGIAAIAFGESKASQPEPELQIDDSGLIIEQGEAEIQQRKLDAVRKEDINQSLKALKEELKGNTTLQDAVWKAVESTKIGLKEKRQLLELCSAMFEPDYTLLVTVPYPKYWTCARMPVDPTKISPSGTARKSLVLKFTQRIRTHPRQPPIVDLPPPPLPILEARPPETKKIKLSSRPSFNGSLNGGSSFNGLPSPIVAAAAAAQTHNSHSASTPAPYARKDSISVTLSRPATPAATVPFAPSTAQAPPSASAAPAAPPAPAFDSIAVQPVARLSTPLRGTPPPNARAPSQQLNGSAKPAEKRPKLVKKRKSNEAEFNDRPKKVAKTSVNGVRPGANGRPSKVVTLPFTQWDKLSEHTRRTLKIEKSSHTSSSTIVATPTTKRITSASDRPSSPSATGFSGSGREGPGSQNSSGVGLSSSSHKQRKPLPSSAPHGPPPSAATTSGAAAPTSQAPIKKVIKLKLSNSSSQQSPSQPSPPR